MGGEKGSPPGPSQQVTSGEIADQNALAALVNQETQQSNQLFNLTEPGLGAAENFYQTLQSGDPGAIMRAIAPAAQQQTQAAQGATSNILANAPAGGEKNLALEQVQANRASGIASTATGASLGANNALGQLAGQGIGESQQGASIATSGLGTSLSGWQGLGNLQIEGQQLQMEQKGQELGALGGLAGDASQLGAAGISSQGGKALATALAA
jgi:hypothetical protein